MSRQQRAMHGKATSLRVLLARPPQFDIRASKVHVGCCTQQLVPQGKASLRFIGYTDR